MDIEAYRLRKKKSVAELAKMLGVKEAAIYNYMYGKSKPSYESIEKMLLDGAFLSEIFNDSVQLKVLESLNPAPSSENGDIFESPEFKAGVVKAIEDMKKMGLLK